MSASSIGMILDRALTPELLDIALRVATDAGERKDARRLLTVALRDHVSAQEAEGKTKKCLTRVWVHPPDPAREMIRLAIYHQDLAADRADLHLGAKLATFPFAGAVASLVGRQLHLEGFVDPRRIRADARASLGDRSTIDVGARKVVTTLRHLGLLEGADGKPLVLGRQPVVPSALTGWIMHGLLLTRRLSAVGVDEASRAFELATVKVENTRPNRYPLLDLHAEGSRTVAVPRSR
jgi:hypothetical protein